jgi:hypothetical protein
MGTPTPNALLTTLSAESFNPPKDPWPVPAFVRAGKSQRLLHLLHLPGDLLREVMRLVSEGSTRDW